MLRGRRPLNIRSGGRWEYDPPAGLVASGSVEVTTSDPILYPAPQTTSEGLRQNVTRARADLMETLDVLAGRAPALAARVRRTVRTAGLGALGAGVVSVAGIIVWRRLSGRGRLSFAVAVPAIATAGAVAYVKARRTAAARSASDNPTAAPTRPLGRRDDVVDLLVAQHRQIAGSFAAVAAARGWARTDQFARLVDMVQRHERAEQQLVHPMLGDVGASAEVAAQRVAEENRIERALSTLISLGPDRPGFDADLDELARLILAHMQREEDEEFPLLRRDVPAADLWEAVRTVEAAQWGRPWNAMESDRRPPNG
jgi:hypothetical protein